MAADTKPIPTVLHGGATFSERLAGLNFQLSPAAFFQTNTDQAETLIQLVSAAASEDLPALDFRCCKLWQSWHAAADPPMWPCLCAAAVTVTLSQSTECHCR